MSSKDTRVVEMQFDNVQFEKGVAQTMRTLEKLENRLDMKGAEEGFQKLDQAVNQVDMTHLLNNLDKASTHFNKLHTITGKYVDKIKNDVVAALDKAEKKAISFTKSLSTDQIGKGLDKFSQKLTAVRTISLALPDTSMDTIYETLDRLNDYTDQTSYNFTDMADKIGLFTAAGVGLETSEKSMEGIANWAASCGKSGNSAAAAFSNMADALSSGKLLLKDWMSIENMNMASQGIKQAFLDAGVAAGTLKKTTDKSGKSIYKTAVKGAKAQEVTIENFRNTLNTGWATKDVITGALSKYYQKDLEIEASDVEALEAKLKDYDEQIKKTTDSKKKATLETERMATADQLTAAKAYMAGREAISLQQAIDAVKEAVSTGWMHSFELIFGKVEEASAFFTDLADTFIDVADRISGTRNKILETWNALGGRTALLDGLENLKEALGAFAKPIHDGIMAILNPLGLFQKITSGNSLIDWSLGIDKAFRNMDGTISGLDELYSWMENNSVVAGAKTGIEWLDNLVKETEETTFTKIMEQKLLDLSNSFKEFSANVVTWLNTATEEGGLTRAEKISNVVVGIVAAFDMLKQAISGIIGFGKDIIAMLGPTWDALLNIASALGSLFLMNDLDLATNNPIGKLFDFLKKIVGPIAEVINTITGFFSGMITYFLGLGGKLGSSVTGWFAGFFEGLPGKISEIAGKVGSFLEDMLGTVLYFISGTAKAEEQGETVVNERLNHFMLIADRIKAFVAPFINTIREILNGFKLFGGGAIEGNEPNDKISEVAQRTFDTLTKIKEGWTRIRTAFADIGAKVAQVFGGVIDGFKLFSGKTIEGDPNDKISDIALKTRDTLTTLHDLIAPFTGFLKDSFGKIRTFFQNGPSKEGFVNLYEGLGESFSSAFQGMKDAIRKHFPQVYKGLQTVSNGIKNGWKKVKEVMSPVIGPIVELAKKTFGTLADLFRNGINEENLKIAWRSIKANVGEFWKKFRNGAGDFWKNMKTTVTAVWGKVKLSLSTFIENFKVWFKREFPETYNWLKEAKNKIETAYNNIKNWLKPITDPIKKLLETLGKEISQLLGNPITKETLSTWWTNTRQAFKDFFAEFGIGLGEVSGGINFGEIIGKIFGKKGDGEGGFSLTSLISGFFKKEDQETSTAGETAETEKKGLLDKIKEMFNIGGTDEATEEKKTMFQKIQDIFSPANGGIAGGISTMLGSVIDLLIPSASAEEATSEVSGPLSSLFSTVSDGVQEVAKEAGSEESKATKASILESIKGIFNGTKEGFSSGTFTGVAESAKALITTLGSWSMIKSLKKNGNDVTKSITDLFKSWKFNEIADKVKNSTTLGSITTLTNTWTETGKGVKDFLQNVQKSGLNVKVKKTQSVGLQILEICAGIGIIAYAMMKLSEMPEDAWKEGLKRLGIVSGVLVVMYGFIKLIDMLPSGGNHNIGFGTFVGMALAVVLLAGALQGLAAFSEDVFTMALNRLFLISVILWMLTRAANTRVGAAGKSTGFMTYMGMILMFEALMGALEPLAKMDEKVFKDGAVRVFAVAGILSVLTLAANTHIGKVSGKSTSMWSYIGMAIAIQAIIAAIAPMADYSFEQFGRMAGMLGYISLILILLTQFAKQPKETGKAVGLSTYLGLAIAFTAILRAIQPFANYDKVQLMKAGGVLLAVGGLMLLITQVSKVKYGDKATSMWTYVGVAIAVYAILAAVKPFAEFNKERLVKIGGMLLVVSIVIAALGKVVGNVGGGIGGAIGGVLVMAAIVGAVVIILHTLKTITDGMSNRQAIMMVALLGTVAIIVGLMALVMDKISRFRTFGSGLKAIGLMAIGIGVVGLVVDALAEIFTDTFTKSMLKISESFALSMPILKRGLNEANTITQGDLNQATLVVDALYQMLWKFVNDIVRNDTVSQNIEAFGRYCGSIGTAISNFKTQYGEGVAITDVVQAQNVVAVLNSIMNVITDQSGMFTKLTSFAINAGLLGSSLNNFKIRSGGSLNSLATSLSVRAIGQINELLISVGSNSDLYTQEKISPFVGRIQEIAQAFNMYNDVEIDDNGVPRGLAHQVETVLEYQSLLEDFGTSEAVLNGIRRFGQLGAAVKLYADGFGQYKLSNLTFEGLSGFLQSMFSSVNFEVLIDELPDNLGELIESSNLPDSGTITDFALSLIALATGVSDFTKAASGVTEDTIPNVTKVFNFITELETKLKERASNPVDLVSAINESGLAIGDTTEASGVLTDNWSALEMFINQLGQLATSLSSFTAAGNELVPSTDGEKGTVDKVIEVVDMLLDINDKLKPYKDKITINGDLGQTIASFATWLATDTEEPLELTTFEAFLGQLSGLGMVLDQFGKDVAGLESVDTEKIESIVGSVQSIYELTNEDTDFWNYLTGGGYKLWKNQEQQKEYQQFLTDLGALGRSLGVFGDNIKSLQDDTITNNAVKIVTAMSDLVKAMPIMKETAFGLSKEGTIDWNGMNIGLEGFGPAMKQFLEDINETFTDENGAYSPPKKEVFDTVEQMFGALGKLGEALPKTGPLYELFNGTVSFGKLGTELPLLADGLKGFVEHIKGVTFDESSLTALNTFADIPIKLKTELILAGARDLTEVLTAINSSGLSTYGTIISTFNSKMSAIGDDEKASMISGVTFLEELTTAIDGVSKIKDVRKAKSNAETLVDILMIGFDNKATENKFDKNTLADGIKAFSDSLIGLDASGAIVGASVISQIALAMQQLSDVNMDYAEGALLWLYKNPELIGDAVNAIASLTSAGEGGEGIDLDSVKDYAYTVAMLGSGLESLKNVYSAIGANGETGDWISEMNTLITEFIEGFDMTQFDVLIEEIDAKLSGGLQQSESNARTTFAAVISNTANSGAPLAKGYYPGRNFATGFAAGIRSGTGIASAAASALVAAAMEAANKTEDANSPAKELIKTGKWFSLGFANGIMDYGYAAQNASEDVTRMAIDSAAGALTNFTALMMEGVDPNPTIRPVLDLSDIMANAGQIDRMLGSSTISVGTIRGRELAMGASYYDYEGHTGNRSSLDAIGQKIDALEEAIIGMQVVMDTGALVGSISSGIDRQLGRNAYFAGRGL